MVNVHNTVTAVSSPLPSMMSGVIEPAPAPAKGRSIAFAAGAIGILALAAIVAAPLLNRPLRPVATSNPGGPVTPVAGPPTTPSAEQPPANVVSATKRMESLPSPPPKPVSPHARYERLLTWIIQNRGSIEAVTGAGQPVSLASLNELPNEQITILKIKLDGTGVRDSELTNLADAPGLDSLSLADTKITDAGLAHLENLRQLKHLNLARTGIKSAGLAHLARLSELVELDLSRTQITDQGLARLTGLGMLERLNLADTAITDSGIDQLKSLRSLKQLTLNGTGLTEAEHQSLGAALPQLQIAWDGADLQRAVALRLLEKGAVVAVVDRAGQVHAGLKTRESLPPGRIVVKAADLSPATGIGEDDLKQLVSLPEIESLSLVSVTLTPAGFAHLQGLASLKTIDLGTPHSPLLRSTRWSRPCPTAN